MKSLLKAFQFIFGCRHPHQSRVFTIKHRTYRVCFDWGKEFDLPDAHIPCGPTLLWAATATNPRHDR